MSEWVAFLFCIQSYQITFNKNHIKTILFQSAITMLLYLEMTVFLIISEICYISNIWTKEFIVFDTSTIVYSASRPTVTSIMVNRLHISEQ